MKHNTVQRNSRTALTIALVIALVVALIGAGAYLLTRRSAPPVNLSGPPGQWKMTWSDEFNGSQGDAPDSGKWGHEIGNKENQGWGNGERQYYTDSRANSYQDGQGNLAIVARSGNPNNFDCWYGPCQYTSARLLTKGKFDQKYGYFEARIKIPRGQGMWPSFWMLGDNIDSVGWPDAGEIDIFENKGKEPDIVHGTIHGPANRRGNEGINKGSGTGEYKLPGGRAFADDFHTVAIEWTPDSISWYVDGNKYQTRSKAELQQGDWVYDHPFYMLLNVAVGGRYGGEPNETTTFPQTMLVDYVRVYERSS